MRHLNSAAQIGHKHERTTQQPDQHHIAAAIAVVFGDLAAKFGNTGLNFLLGNHYVYSVFHSFQVSCRKKGAEFSIAGGRWRRECVTTSFFAVFLKPQALYPMDFKLAALAHPCACGICTSLYGTAQATSLFIPRSLLL
ncbi:hypothetical protein D3C76_1520810 [compost metagenome]